MSLLQNYIATLKNSLDDLPWHELDLMTEKLVEACRNERRIFVFGNGGSAATATHVACDLAKNTRVPNGPKCRALSLNDNGAALTAFANDHGYENVFAEQLVDLVQSQDVVLAISTSGNSENVLRAVEVAKRANATTIGWCGFDGGRLATMVDLAIVVRSECVEQIEDMHLILGHMMTLALRTHNLQTYAPPANAMSATLTMSSGRYTWS